MACAVHFLRDQITQRLAEVDIRLLECSGESARQHDAPAFGPAQAACPWPVKAWSRFAVSQSSAASKLMRRLRSGQM